MNKSTGSGKIVAGLALVAATVAAKFGLDPPRSGAERGAMLVPGAEGYVIEPKSGQVSV